MSPAVAANRSGARRLWDTDPFLLLDWDAPDWDGAQPAGSGWSDAELFGTSTTAPAWEPQTTEFDWTGVERATWNTAERAVLDGSDAVFTPSVSLPSAAPGPEAAWDSTPEWLVPDWTAPPEAPVRARHANPPAPATGDLPGTGSTRTSVPLPRRRDLRAAERAEAAALARDRAEALPETDDLDGTTTLPAPIRGLDEAPARSLDDELGGTISLPRRRDLRTSPEAPARAPRKRRRLASATLGSVAARVAVLTVLGSVGAATVTGNYPDFLSFRGDIAGARTPGYTLPDPGTVPAAYLAAQADYTERRGAINAELAVEDKTSVALTLAKKLSAQREAARIEAAEKAAAKARAEAMARAVREARSNPRAVGKLMAADRGWTGSQWTCLNSLWTRESNWNYQASNPSSGAYGIPQSLPGSKMASAGSDWQTNPITQIEWGLDYIAGRYGTPCGAWAHSEDVGWY